MNNPSFRFLTCSQIEKLLAVLTTRCTIHPVPQVRDALSTLQIPPLTFLKILTAALQHGGVDVRYTNLVGGAASYVLGNQDSCASYHDIDVAIGVHFDLSEAHKHMTRIRNCVFQCLQKFYLDKTHCPDPSCYVSKQFKLVPSESPNAAGSGDCWSLISLHNMFGRNLELKFIHTLERGFESSVDSFQILLHPLDNFDLLGKSTELKVEKFDQEFPALDGPELRRSDNVLQVLKPTPSRLPKIQVISKHAGGIDEALHHLFEKLICIEEPMLLRGGGLLKYCYLRTTGYDNPASVYVPKLENYMINRFLIDFNSRDFQHQVIKTYLNAHFSTDNCLGDKYLQTLYNLVCTNVNAKETLLFVVNNILEYRTVANGTTRMSPEKQTRSQEYPLRKKNMQNRRRLRAADRRECYRKKPV